VGGGPLNYYGVITVIGPIIITVDSLFSTHSSLSENSEETARSLSSEISCRAARSPTTVTSIVIGPLSPFVSIMLYGYWLLLSMLLQISIHFAGQFRIVLEAP